jgi:hypothetical protein
MDSINLNNQLNAQMHKLYIIEISHETSLSHYTECYINNVQLFECKHCSNLYRPFKIRAHVRVHLREEIYKAQAKRDLDIQEEMFADATKNANFI